MHRIIHNSILPASFTSLSSIDFVPLSSGSTFLNGRRIYPFNKGLQIYGGVYHPPFDTFKKCTFAYDMNLKLYR